MNLLHLISSSGFFGAERVVCELCRCSVTPGLAMHIAVLTRDEGLLASFKKAVSRPEVEVIGIPCSGRMDLKAVKALKRIVADRQIDILHSHGYKSDFFALLARVLIKRRLRLFSTNHLWVGTSASEKFYQFIDAWILRKFERVIAVSDQIREEMLACRIPSGKISVVYNGIDVDDSDFTYDRTASQSLLGLKNDGIAVGNIGRLTTQKAHNDLIEAFSICKNEFPNLTLTIIGEGPERSHLEQLIRDKNLGGAVTLAGNTDHARRCYAAFDIFALPSLNEGLPMVLLEAMAAGVPVIASSVGAVPRVIQHENNGLLISPGDTDQLVQAMRRLAADPDLRAELSRQGADTVRNDFSSHAMARRYWELYEDGSRRTAYGARKQQNRERVTAEGVGEKVK